MEFVLVFVGSYIISKLIDRAATRATQVVSENPPRFWLSQAVGWWMTRRETSRFAQVCYRRGYGTWSPELATVILEATMAFEDASGWRDKLSAARDVLAAVLGNTLLPQLLDRAGGRRQLAASALAISVPVAVVGLAYLLLATDFAYRYHLAAAHFVLAASCVWLASDLVRFNGRLVDRRRWPLPSVVVCSAAHAALIHLSTESLPVRLDEVSINLSVFLMSCSLWLGVWADRRASNGLYVVGRCALGAAALLLAVTEFNNVVLMATSAPFLYTTGIGLVGLVALRFSWTEFRALRPDLAELLAATRG